MVKSSKGSRRRTRKKLKKHPRERGIQPLGRIIQDFEEGDLVNIKIDPSVVKGMPHPRFHGHTGRIIGKRGRAYLVQIKDGGKEKILISRPNHLHLAKS